MKSLFLAVALVAAAGAYTLFVHEQAPPPISCVVVSADVPVNPSLFASDVYRAHPGNPGVLNATTSSPKMESAVQYTKVFCDCSRTEMGNCLAKVSEVIAEGRRYNRFRRPNKAMVPASANYLVPDRYGVELDSRLLHATGSVLTI